MTWGLRATGIVVAALMVACAEPAPSDRSAGVTPEAAAGSWIVFASGRSGDGDLYAVHPETREIVPVLTSPALEGSPRWDAARARIVHHRFAGDSAILWAEGERLFPDPNGDVSPAWSPDGSWVVYAAARDGQEDLFLARSDGSMERRLTNSREVDRYPSWSPDGTRIVFARRLESGWDLHALDLEDGGLGITRLTQRETYVGHPAWSPDGSRIAFDTSYDGEVEIAVLELDSGRVTRITERAGNDLIPSWAPDGTALAFGADVGGAGNWDVWLWDAESGELDRLTSDPAGDGGPIWVPAAVIGR